MDGDTFFFTVSCVFSVDFISWMLLSSIWIQARFLLTYLYISIIISSSTIFYPHSNHNSSPQKKTIHPNLARHLSFSLPFVFTQNKPLIECVLESHSLMSIGIAFIVISEFFFFCSFHWIDLFYLLGSSSLIPKNPFYLLPS